MFAVDAGGSIRGSCGNKGRGRGRQRSGRVLSDPRKRAGRRAPKRPGQRRGETLQDEIVQLRGDNANQRSGLRKSPKILRHDPSNGTLQRKTKTHSTSLRRLPPTYKKINE